MRYMKHLDQWITRHQESSGEPRYGRARLLAWLLVFSFGVTVPVLLHLLFLSIQDPYRVPYIILVSAVALVISAAFFLNRYGNYLTAAALFTACAVAGPWASLVFDPGILQGDFLPLAYISLSVLIASILLPLAAAAVLAVVQFAVLAVLLFSLPVSHVINLPSFFAFLFFLSGLSVISNLLSRRDMEQINSQHGQLMKLSQKLKEQSIRDHLTGVFNRRYLESAVHQEILRASERNISFCVVMLDIDHFKQLNDTQGHAAGDRLLNMLGEYLTSQVRIADVVCRYGGDEFVLLFPGAERKTIEQTAEKIRLGVQQLCIDAGMSGITISLGIAVFPEHGRTKEKLTAAADAALYRAKAGGRNLVMTAENQAPDRP